MVHPKESTIVLYPSGACESPATIVGGYVDRIENKTIIFTDKTVFHPVDHKWPDQPADEGSITLDSNEHVVKDCYIVAYNKEDQLLYVGSNIPVGRFEPGWIFLVAHEVSTVVDLSIAIGNSCYLAVNEVYRQNLSKVHTGVHLASLALNAAVNDLWKKDVLRDDLGHYDFDQRFIISSKISVQESVDTYRLSKSAKRKGFLVSDFFENIAGIESSVNQIISEWITETGSIFITPTEGPLTQKRQWVWYRNDLQVTIPCGGTHLENINNLNAVSVILSRINDGPEFIMITKASIS